MEFLFTSLFWMNGIKGAGVEIYQYFIEFFFGTFFPAFVLAGGIKVFIRERSITKWMGPEVSGFISYPFSLLSGLLFSVCACGVLPLFASIYRHGAGVGPAVTFLVAGPAINITAIILTTSFFSIKMTIARTIGALFLAFFIGLIFSFIFKQPQPETYLTRTKNNDEKKSECVPCNLEKAGEDEEDFDLLDPDYNYLEDEELDEAYIPIGKWKVILLFVVTFAYMVTGPVDFSNYMSKLNGGYLKITLLISYILFLGIFIRSYLKKEDQKEFLIVIGHFIFKISRPLIIGLAILGFVKGNLSNSTMADIVMNYLSEESLKTYTISSLFAVPTYFGTCVSVIYVKFFMDFGMAKGAALTMFLAGPTISIPSFLPMVEIMGWKRAIFVTFQIFTGAIILTLLLLSFI